MSEPTLYRINPDADDRDVFHAVSTDPGEEPPMIPAEPTDRICTFHGNTELAGATSCDADDSFESWRDCKMVDVVRMEEGEHL